MTKNTMDPGIYFLIEAGVDNTSLTMTESINKSKLYQISLIVYYRVQQDKYTMDPR